MGQCEYGLKSLADDQLLAGLASVVARRNQVTAEFLAYLAEVDDRQLFLDLGYSSLFEYCVKKLKLCESTAGRHIAAARVCRSHPEVFALVVTGALHASALSLLKKYLTPENAAELFVLCMHQSARKVEDLLAARFPRSDVRDLVRRLPKREQSTLNVESSEVQATPMPPTQDELSTTRPTTELAQTPAVSCGQATTLPKVQLESSRPEHAAPHRSEASRPRRFEPLSADRYGVHFTADGDFCALLERVRGLAGHRLPGGDLMTLLKRGLEAYERELERERFAVGRKARRTREAAPAPEALTAPDAPQLEHSTPDLPEREGSVPGLGEPDPTSSTAQSRPRAKRKRYYPAEVVRTVFLRDGRRCTYVSPDGQRCSARRCLELDHIEPLAMGGETTIENLRLRCRAHNQWYARRYFGASRVNAAIREARAARRRGAKQTGCSRTP